MNATLLTLALLAASPAPQAADLVVAAHEGEVTRAAFLWRSSLLVREARPGEGKTVRLPLSPPLPPDARIELKGGHVERDKDGEAVALVVDLSRLLTVSGPHGIDRRVEVKVEQPRRDDARRLRLAAPLVAGEGVQRVALLGAEPVRFHPDDGLGIERRVGLAAARDVDRGARHRLDRTFGRLSPAQDRLYLRVGSAVAERGLVGVLDEAPARRSGVGLAAAGLFALLLLAAAALYRRASRQAEIERVDAILAEDYRGFG